MTHLSDFSYLERCTIWVYISVYFVYSVYVGDRFKCLRFKSIISGELKSIITILLILMLVMQFMWDIASTYVKYTEGFIALSATEIYTKPFSMWSPSHQTLMMAMDYVECVTFSLQTGVLFLLQSFWNYLSNTYARKSFMGSLEFKFYILWALASMAMFPILQWVYRDDVYKREAIPQLAYGCEGMVASLLGIRSHFRFKKIISLSEKNNGASNKSIVTRLSYFKDMNLMITIILFFYAASFIVICSDGLTHDKIINSNKFAMDTVIANVNICTVFILLLLISIFHPRPQYTREIGDSTRNDSSYVYSSNTKPGRATNFAKNNEPTDIEAKYIGSAITTPASPNNNNNNNSGGFMRAMSPVTVDYPGSLGNDTMPLTSSPGLNRSLSPVDQKDYNTRSMAIEDPYSNEQVMFSMMDMKQNRYASPTSPIPMRGMSPRYDDYEQTTSPTRIRRPSWERNPTSPTTQYTDQSGDKMVRDWLWQSPDRRNT